MRSWTDGGPLWAVYVPHAPWPPSEAAAGDSLDLGWPAAACGQALALTLSFPGLCLTPWDADAGLYALILADFPGSAAESMLITIF